LYGCSDGAENDGKVEGYRLAPLVVHLITESSDFVLIDMRDRFIGSRVSCNKSSPSQCMFVGGVNIILTNEFVNVPNDFGLGKMGKWVLDSIYGLVDVCKDANI